MSSTPHSRARRWAGIIAATALAAAAGLAACSTPRAGGPPVPTAIAGQPGAVTRTTISHPQGMTCAAYRIPVTASATDPTLRHVVGHLCYGRAGYGRGRTVQVLLPGGGYDHRYWMWPSARYSYARAATRAGSVTLAMDMLGVGQADHPAGAGLTYGVQAWALHQVVTQLHRGGLGQRWPRVVAVGHSMGGYEAWTEAGTWHDVQAVVIADAAHTLYTPTVATLTGHMQPTDHDARYRSLTWASAQYMAIRAGTRGDYYWSAGADPAVIAADERLDGTVAVPLGQLTDLERVQASTVPGRITVPVLVVVGQHDALFCGDGNDCAAAGNPIHHECQHYTAAPSCRVHVVPDAGHDTNLHRTAPAMFAYVGRWLATHPDTRAT